MKNEVNEVKVRLNTNVSFYTSVYSRESDRIISFKSFLRTVAIGTYRNQVRYIAAEQNKASRRKLKTSLLPSITIPGVFSPTRRIENLIDTSGVIAIDIDPPDDIHDEEQQEFAFKAKEILSSDNYVLAMHYTASYRGIVVYFLIPQYINNLPAEINYIYGMYYKKLSDYLWNNYKLPVDAAPKSIASLRFFSYDKELYINTDCRVYEIDISINIPILTLTKSIKTPVSSNTGRINNSSIEAIYNLTDALIRERVDITIRYHDWLRIAYGISTSFGENGRDIFHRISSIYSAYSPEETNRMFTHAVKKANGRLTVATVFKLAFDKGIKYERK